MLFCMIRETLLVNLIKIFNWYCLMPSISPVFPASPILSSDFISYEGIVNILLNLKIKSGPGPGNVPNEVL